MADLGVACRRRKERQRGLVKREMGRATGDGLGSGSSVGGDAWWWIGTGSQRPRQGGIDDETAGEERRKVADELAGEERQKEVDAGRARGSQVRTRCGGGRGCTWWRRVSVRDIGPSIGGGRWHQGGAPAARNRAGRLGDGDGESSVVLGRTRGRQWRRRAPRRRGHRLPMDLVCWLN